MQLNTTTAGTKKPATTKASPKTPTKAKPATKVNGGGLDLDAVLIRTDKVARADHNRDRHKDLDGMTVFDALATRRVDARDIRYDISKGFMTTK